jgi:DNA-binding transcriptional regulator YiaG
MLGRVVNSAPAEILVPERAGASAGLPVEWQIVGRQESSQRDPALSYTVDRLPVDRLPARTIEHLRNRQGLSQRALATRIGVSQGQYANARRGHDPLSAFAVNRLREMLAAQDRHKLR